MSNKPILVVLSLLLLMVTACAPMRSTTTAPAQVPEPPAPIEDTAEPEEPKPREVEPPQQKPAVSALINQGWSAYRNNDYQGALAYAERAQRIDPRSPEVYLLMAKAQLGLYQGAVAEQLARRGLAFARSGTAIYGQLQALLGEIAASQ